MVGIEDRGELAGRSSPSGWTGKEVVVFEVLDTAEHEFEFGKPGLLEAFIGFKGARGLALRLELYLPSSTAETRANLLAALLPLAVMGPLAL